MQINFAGKIWCALFSSLFLLRIFLEHPHLVIKLASYFPCDILLTLSMCDIKGVGYNFMVFATCRSLQRLAKSLQFPFSPVFWVLRENTCEHCARMILTPRTELFSLDESNYVTEWKSDLIMQTKFFLFASLGLFQEVVVFREAGIDPFNSKSTTFPKVSFITTPDCCVLSPWHNQKSKCKKKTPQPMHVTHTLIQDDFSSITAAVSLLLILGRLQLVILFWHTRVLPSFCQQRQKHSVPGEIPVNTMIGWM